MKKAGLVLIWLMFFAASLVAVLEASTLNWLWYLPLLALGFVGVTMARMGAKQHAEAAHRVSANIEMIHKSLDSVVKKVRELNQDKANINTYDMRHKIDERLLDDLDNFVEARETIGIKFGLQHYADVMSHFAAGERYLNRVWSASADGYIDEVNAYMDKAEEQFEAAHEMLKQLGPA